jgi:hypothetical protein
MMMVALTFAGGGGWALAARSTVEVPAGRSVAEAIEGAPAGATVRLLPGRHAPFEVSRRVTVRALPGAVVKGPVTIRADGARLSGVVIRGGESGVTVDRARDVRLDGLVVRSAELHGVEVVAGTAVLRNCSISGLTNPFAQGVEVRNASGLGRSVVEGCVIEGGQEGIVSHVSRIEVLGNEVGETSMRAIAVTEMSEGLVEGNRVRGAVGIGIYCGDESHCEVRGNDVAGVSADPAGVRSRAGYPVVAWYHSVIRAEDNRLAGAAPRVVGLFLDSRRTGTFPLLVWPPGWPGAIPALWVAALSLAGVGLVRLGAGRWLRGRRRPASGGEITTGAVAVLTGGFLVQSFHMLEHVVQVVQAQVLEAEIRSGLLGRLVDTEWVHFAYNAAVLGFLVWAWRLLRSEGPLAAVGAGGVAWMAAAIVVQSYHMLEHGAKIVQHLSTGVDPAPGLVGGEVGLVWFHFGINLAVYAAMTIPLIRALATMRHRILPHRSLVTARLP